MYNKSTNEITFPHIIGGKFLNKTEIMPNAMCGGVKMITEAPFNLFRNQFFGGNVTRLMFMPEYGFYGCPHYMDIKNILGFYIHDPEVITAKGRQAIEAQYPNVKIRYITTSCTPHREFTKEEMAHKQELIAEAIEKGAKAPAIENNTPDELEGLLRALDSGKAKAKDGSDLKVMVEEVLPVADNVPVKIIHRGRQTANA